MGRNFSENEALSVAESGGAVPSASPPPGGGHPVEPRRAPFSQEEISAWIAKNGVTTEKSLRRNQFYRLKFFFRDRRGSVLAKASAGKRFNINGGVPTTLRAIVAHANVLCAEHGERPFDYEKVKADWRKIKRRGRSRG